MATIDDGFRFNTWWGIGDAWSAKTTYGTTDKDENRFYVGGSSTRGRTRLGFTIPTSYTGPTELVIGMRPDETATISYMRAFLTTNGNISSDADVWASASILASSYFYSDINCTSRITGETINWVYCKLNYNFTPGTTYYIGIFPYATSTSIGNTNYNAVWFRGRNAANYLWSRLTYQGTYTVTYNANGGTGTMSPSTVTYNSSFMTRKNAFTRVGYTFNGWNEKADGTGTAWGLSSAGVYESGKSWTWTYTHDITLYAQWKIKTYTISYDANGGKGAPASQTKTYGVDIKLSTTVPTRDKVVDQSKTVTVTFNANGGTCDVASKEGVAYTVYAFAYWVLGNNITFTPGQTYSGNRDLHLFAEWSSSTERSAISLPVASKEEYVFLGWSTDQTADNIISGLYTPTSNITLYAIYQKDIPKLDYYSLYLGSSCKNVYLGSKEYKVVVPPVSTK